MGADVAHSNSSATLTESVDAGHVVDLDSARKQREGSQEPWAKVKKSEAFDTNLPDARFRVLMQLRTLADSRTGEIPDHVLDRLKRIGKGSLAEGIAKELCRHKDASTIRRDLKALHDSCKIELEYRYSSTNRGRRYIDGLRVMWPDSEPINTTPQCAGKKNPPPRKSAGKKSPQVRAKKTRLKTSEPDQNLPPIVPPQKRGGEGSERLHEPPVDPVERVLAALAPLRCGRDQWRVAVRGWVEKVGIETAERLISDAIVAGVTRDDLTDWMAAKINAPSRPATVSADTSDADWQEAGQDLAAHMMAVFGKSHSECMKRLDDVVAAMLARDEKFPRRAARLFIRDRLSVSIAIPNLAPRFWERMAEDVQSFPG